jgi:hypothetical protein
MGKLVMQVPSARLVPFIQRAAQSVLSQVQDKLVVLMLVSNVPLVNTVRLKA